MIVDIDALTAVPGNPGFNRHRRVIAGKGRIVDAPNDHTKAVHGNVKDLIRAHALRNPYATAGPGRSTVTNAKIHRRNRFFLCYDLHNAYQTVKAGWVYDLFAPTPDQMELFTEELADDALTRFIHDYFVLPCGSGLRTGGPACQDIFNQIAELRLDLSLASFCRRWGITYTRYVDDLTFSSQKAIGCQLQRGIKKAIRRAGFKLSFDKVQYGDVTKNPVVITGIGIDRNARIFIPQGQLRTIRGLLNRAMHSGDVPINTVRGYIGYFRSVYPKGTRLTASEQKIEELCRLNRLRLQGAGG